VIIDISEQVLARFRSQDLVKRNTVGIKKQMISWLEQNVGAYQIEITPENGRAYVGAGWEWGTQSVKVGDQFQTTWFVKIDDEAAATMFRLKFL
jgi:hypothetical protein